MIGIIGAMAIEVKLLKEQMTEKKEERVSSISFVCGKLHGQDVVVAQSGVGKVSAATCAQTMVLHFGVKKLLSIGVGGALSPELHIGDVIIASGCVEHDMDTSPVGDPVGWISGLNLVELPVDKAMAEELIAICKAQGLHYLYGIVASGDQFISSEEKASWIRKTFNAVSSEMEAAAIAHVAFMNQCPFASLRVASDEANGKSPSDYESFKAKAAATSSAIVLQWLASF